MAKTGSLFLAAITLFMINPELKAAALLTSDPFFFGYGAQANGANSWVLRTSGSSTAGDFVFSPTLLGPSYSSYGPLYDGTALLSTPNASANYTGQASAATLSVSGSWSGNLNEIEPGLLNDHAQIHLVITSIQVYATYYSATADSSNPTLTLIETTPGKENSFATLAVHKTVGAENGNLNALTKAANFTILEWNPTNPWDSGTSTTRTFAFQIGDAANIHIDGFQISGYIEVIPEPGTYALLLTGIGTILIVTRRQRALPC